MRVHVCAVRMTLHRADVLEAYLNGQDNIQKATVYERTGDVVLTYRGSRKDAAALLAAYRFDNEELEVLVTSHDSRKINQEYQEKMVSLVAGRVFRKVFLPAPIAAAYTVWCSIAFVWKGIRCLLHRKLEVEVLDALSITASLLRGDYSTAGSVMFLLTVGSLLEEWTRKKSLDDLARSMALNVDKVWVRTPQGEVLVPLTRVHAGDEVVVRSGNMIPLDGMVLEGEAMVNQAALTGESMPVRKTTGATVYAGTVVEEGECVLVAKAEGGANRYDKIVAMIEESEKLKSGTENRALQLADRLVPWCLAGTVATYAFTRNVTRAISILMVDFSCALKLSMPLAVLSAMRECGEYHITVKGGKYLEALAKADTIVFDKTGTLTEATPNVACVLALDGWNRREVLRLAACLEEHFPHPVARAVVRAAAEKNLRHRERHADVEYLVAHGIASSLDGKRVVIGSEHFVVEDEGVSLTEEQKRRVAEETEGLSPLYLAVDGELIGVIGIEDPLKAGVREAIADLRMLGFKRVVMLTGDGERTAARIADAAGVTEYRANLLPEDKYAFVERLKAEGSKVVMVGDGVNDAPALAGADVGVAIGAGTDVAIESADVVLMKNDLRDVPAAIRLSKAVIRNIRENLFWAFFYNVIGIPLAAGVWYPIFGWKLNPMFGAAAMSLSSFCVVTNALRLNLFSVHGKANKDAAPAAEPVEIKTSESEEKVMTKTMHIEGMMCGHCEATVKKALEALPEVTSAEVSHEAGTAVVTLSSEVADDVLKKTVEEKDYKVTAID